AGELSEAGQVASDAKAALASRYRVTGFSLRDDGGSSVTALWNPPPAPPDFARVTYSVVSPGGEVLPVPVGQTSLSIAEVQVAPGTSVTAKIRANVAVIRDAAFVSVQVVSTAQVVISQPPAVSGLAARWDVAADTLTLRWSGPPESTTATYDVRLTETPGDAPLLERTGLVQTALTATATGLRTGMVYTAEVRAVETTVRGAWIAVDVVPWVPPAILAPAELAAQAHARGDTAAAAAGELVGFYADLDFARLLSTLAAAGWPAVEAAPAARQQRPEPDTGKAAQVIAASYAGIAREEMRQALLACGYTAADVDTALVSLFGGPITAWIGTYLASTDFLSSPLNPLVIAADGTLTVGGLTVGGQRVSYAWDSRRNVLSWGWQPLGGISTRASITFFGIGADRHFNGTCERVFPGRTEPRKEGYMGTLRR
ncbi:MAG TPA: fibronectin type III domain-containing protein, partial [Thermoanaerobaculia bacterium]|nr:fibronectin type III domain-containing protein [Thermoanaerobaculia bacterium]